LAQRRLLTVKNICTSKSDSSTGNRERGTGNGEQGTGNRNGEQERETGTGNRERGMGNGSQGIQNSEFMMEDKGKKRNNLGKCEEVGLLYPQIL